MVSMRALIGIVTALLLAGPAAAQTVVRIGLSAPLYEDAGVVLVTPGASWAALTQRGYGNIFRVVPGDAQQGATAGRYLLVHEPGRRIGVVHDRTTFGRGLADAVSRTLKAGGD